MLEIFKYQEGMKGKAAGNVRAASEPDDDMPECSAVALKQRMTKVHIAHLN
jgi:hypothetical protein